VIEKYSRIGVPFNALLSMGGLVKYYFNLEKAYSHSVVQMNLLFLWRHWKYGYHCSPLAERNRDKGATLPVSRCTSFTLVGLLMLIMVTHLFGLTSMPL